MNKRKSTLLKSFCAVLLLIMCASCMVACSNGSVENQRVRLSDDGVVSKDVFDSMKGKNAVTVFYSDNYEWTFLGTRITQAKEVKLKLEFNSDLGDGADVMFGKHMSMQLPGIASFPGIPSLTLRLEGWESGGVYLYELDNYKPIYRKTVVITDERTTFSLEKLSGGTLIISTERPKGMADDFEINYRDPDKVPPDDSMNPLVTIKITCHTAVLNWNKLKPEVQVEQIVPKSGIILATTEVYVKKGNTVYDVLVSVTKNKIHMESVLTPLYNAVYIQGINNLYEFDGGSLSGWMFSVNGWSPNYGASRYKVKNGDTIEWNYTCDLGRDLGQDWL